MSETPLPQALVATPDLGAGVDDSRPRRRSSPSRPVSAFAPSRASKPVPSESAGLSTADCDFVTALHEAGIALELDGAELTRVAHAARPEPGPARRIDLLEAYYAAEGDPILSQRRKATDRWFIYNL